MKKITKIEYQKKNKDRVSIYLDDNYEFGIDINLMIKYGLCKNMELDESFIDEILISENKTRAYNYAISVLSRGSKSEKELKIKMVEKEYDSDLIELTLNRLKDNKYIDDKDYSERFIRDKINFSKYGKRRIQEALYNKGIDKEIIQEKIGVISTEDEIDRALILGEKKLKGLTKEDNMKKYTKLSNFLVGKGFEYEVVKKVVSKLLKTEYDGYED